MERLRAAPAPLVRGAGPGDEGVRRFAHDRPESLFPGARSAGGALAGLLLLGGCWEEAHEVADGVPTAEGSYWHALVHRMEPQTWNADYWFERVGEHPLFPKLAERARAVAAGGGVRPERIVSGGRWDAAAFNALCDEARASDDAKFVMAVAEIHSIEVHLLWDWCLAGSGGAANE